MQFSEAFNPIRVLKSTFKTMGKTPGLLWGGAILLMILEMLYVFGWGAANWVVQTNLIVSVNPFYWPQSFPGPVGIELRDWFQASHMILFGGGIIIGLIFFFASARVIPGLMHRLRDVLETGSSGDDGIFADQGLFGTVVKMRFLLLVIGIILGIPIFLCALAEAQINSDGNPDASLYGLAVKTGGSLVWSIVWVYIYLGIALTEQAVVYEGLQPVDALKRSWALVQGNRWRFLLYQLLIFVLVMVGYLMCCVGVFGTGALARMMNAEAFLQLTSGDEAPETGDEPA
jgi:hypothetical protein